MLGRIANAIRAAVAALANMVWRVIRFGDRLIAMLIPNPAPTAALAAAENLVPPVTATVESMTALRGAANALVQGYSLTSAVANGVPAMQVSWLRSMTRSELCKMILSKDYAIRLHIKGIAPIRGIVPCDADAIRDVTVARAERPQAVRPPRRTLRAALAERDGLAA